MPNSEKVTKNDSDNDQNISEASGSISNNIPTNRIGNSDDSLEKVKDFMLDGWVAAASPPKFVSLEEIMKAAKGMQNMALAHEIAVDGNFKIDKLDPDGNPLRKKLKEMVHKAFWDILSEELSQDPPVYDQALRLLSEIKESLDELLLPHNAKTKEAVNQVLDIELIKQQAEKGVLDFSHYAQYVINLMAKICAPVRDEKIEELKKCTDVIETFKGIMEVIQLMKLDLANFTISMIRPNIIASSIEYEKKKFAEFLKIQADGLHYTRIWLLNHLSQEIINSASSDLNSIKQMTHSILANAYLDLLEFDSSPNAETLMLDQGRLLDLRNKTCRLVAEGSILILLKPLQVHLTDQQITEMREHITILLNSVTSNKDLETVMKDIIVQVEADLVKSQVDMVNNKITFEYIKNQLLDLHKSDNRIRQLVASRTRQFLYNVITSQSSAPQQIPPGLSCLREGLTKIAAQLAILFAHNRSVFGDYYTEIVAAAVNEKNLTANHN
ncbi:T-complex protein 11-like protein 1 [Trichogramma pretiosum]|uniref:T-complex protein 11-like protein 1 n=1 Tax=Trichogramma pretiosum TaxID=7493 RepID=UPI0006C99189|nr:T-complex protein 11-like protein 1 [Trichogramma pretiosum]XP_014227791.1 T-complex protein 11-like protein 1 [Trichogramma pretiosum]XP_014227792.1 T-complex protein 11-like protein 1 [Trichogramma pretiosum]XP_014227793.1 T-complex protein 11-like protein 1 [Trichogramma pretiosum]